MCMKTLIFCICSQGECGQSGSSDSQEGEQQQGGVSEQRSGSLNFGRGILWKVMRKVTWLLLLPFGMSSGQGHCYPLISNSYHHLFGSGIPHAGTALCVCVCVCVCVYVCACLFALFIGHASFCITNRQDVAPVG
jgi:hypothetical protein